MKKAIITGATGLVGMAVARHLSSIGVSLLCIGRKVLTPARIAEFFGAGTTYLKLAMGDIATLAEEVAALEWDAQDDCVFFSFAWSGRERLTDGTFGEQLTNAINTAEAVRSAKKLGCTKFVDAGTLEETFVERSLRGKGPDAYVSPQTSYALAKLASRDMCRIVAYLEKIDYVHTRLSVPLSPDFSRGTYVAATMKNILAGKPYQEPRSKRLSDLIFVDDVARAYGLIGSSGKNKADYFIGSSRPATLGQYFQVVKECVEGHGHVLAEPNAVDEAELFDTDPLYRDTGFRATVRLEDVVAAMVQGR